MSVESGIIYYNKGFSCIPRLLVSLKSIRKHTQKDITVFLEGENLSTLADDISKNLNVNIIYDNNSNTTTYVRAVEVCMKSPYESSVWMDADTLIMDNFDEVFEDIPNYDISIANFAGWFSHGSGIRKRIMRFNNLIDKSLIDNAIQYGPAINCGFYGFRKNFTFLEEWLKISKIGEKNKIFIPDEVACQILLPKYNTKILPPEYNVSVKYGTNILNPKIIHYHGKKHCRYFPLAELWIDNFIDLLRTNFCNIRSYTSYDRILNRFLDNRYLRENKVQICKKLLQHTTNTSINDTNKVYNICTDKTHKIYNNQPIETETTIVTACDPVYVKCLALTFPTWVEKKSINKFPIIVYINGFQEDDNRLDFLRAYSNVKLINWDMTNVESQREKMLSSFIFGPAKDVTTKYWLKIDADAYAINNNPILNDDMKNYDIVGHKWGYTKPYEWINKLNEWSDSVDSLNHFKYNIDTINIKGRRYFHHRTNSFVQLHSTEFTKLAAEIAGSRLPIPSQDTYLWFIATALNKKIHRYNFKKYAGLYNKRTPEQISNTLNQYSKQQDKNIIKLNVGCGRTSYDGWINTDKNILDITKYNSWIDNNLKINSVDRILAEHVFEHLSEADRNLAISNFKIFIKQNGVIRIAVPDGYHPDPEYIERVKVNGSGPAAHNHKFLYNYKTLTEIFAQYGFKYKLLEFFDENGNFTSNTWNIEDGLIKRSARFDRRNKIKKLSYTSLIIDFIKE